MLTAKELLREDEILLGEYNAEIARWRDNHWLSTIPPVYIILSDQRLIIQPHIRKRHEPAVIPNRYIIGVTKLKEGYRHGVILRLKTGHHIGMLISGDPESKMLANLQTMLITRKKEIFDHKLDLTGIQKIIEFFVSL